MTSPDPVAHLRPETWERANRLLVRKALAEFSHERLLTPEPEGSAADSTGRRWYTVTAASGAVRYRFAARVMTLEHWDIDPESISRHRDGESLPLDAVDFCLDLRDALGLTDRILPVYLEEITSTLAGLAYKLDRALPGAAKLVAADFQTIETSMTEGHPCFVANNGRLGFGVDEYHRYAPEAAHPVRLIWLAAHRDHATFTSSADLDRETLLRTELGEATLARFAATMTELGLDLADYHLIPVHPWQWWNKLSVTFAGEVARRRLVCLGEGPDEYLAQQSIRTFFNVSHPERHYVKTALSVLNMGFMRGLSAAYMEATPAINDWLADLIDGDEVFRATGLTIIRERAAVATAPPVRGRHRPLLPVPEDARRAVAGEPGTRPGGRPETGHHGVAAARRRDGRSFAAELIAASGLAPAQWLRRYLTAYLTPLLHAFYAYDLAFMPHGENVILVLRDGVVERAIFKDIAEEIVVMGADAQLRRRSSGSGPTSRRT